jgi:hypothetical protein
VEETPPRYPPPKGFVSHDRNTSPLLARIGEQLPDAPRSEVPPPRTDEPSHRIDRPHRMDEHSRRTDEPPRTDGGGLSIMGAAQRVDESSMSVSPAGINVELSPAHSEHPSSALDRSPTLLRHFSNPSTPAAPGSRTPFEAKPGSYGAVHSNHQNPLPPPGSQASLTERKPSLFGPPLDPPGPISGASSTPPAIVGPGLAISTADLRATAFRDSPSTYRSAPATSGFPYTAPSAPLSASYAPYGPDAPPRRHFSYPGHGQSPAPSFPPPLIASAAIHAAPASRPAAPDPYTPTRPAFASHAQPQPGSSWEGGEVYTHGQRADAGLRAADARADAAKRKAEELRAELDSRERQVWGLLDEKKAHERKIGSLQESLKDERARVLSATRELDRLHDQEARDRRQNDELRRDLRDEQARASDLELRLRAAEEQARTSALAAAESDHRRQVAETTMEDMKNEAKIPFVVPALFDALRLLSEATPITRS